MNKRVVESLILSGAFDCTGATRAQLMAVYEAALDGANRTRKSNIVGQMSLFGDGMLEEVNPPLPSIPDFNLRTRLTFEKNMTGLYITGHPLGDYTQALAQMDMSTSQLAEIMEGPDHGLSRDGMRVRMGGMLTEFRQKATRSGNLMGFVTLEDMTGTIESLVFPKILERVSTELVSDTAVVLCGRLSIREDEDPKLLLDSIEPLMTNAEIEQAVKNGSLTQNAAAPARKDDPLPGGTLYLRLPSDSAIQVVRPVLSRYKGEIPVVLYIESTGVKLRAPKELYVRPTKAMMDEMTDMLGHKNVVLK